MAIRARHAKLAMEKLWQASADEHSQDREAHNVIFERRYMFVMTRMACDIIICARSMSE